jgi:hypothetical protein
MRKILTPIIFLLSMQTFGQIPDPNLSNVAPPAPNAASLGQYGDVPVSYYTGIPTINIPLYEISLYNYKLPISLSYYASGIHVDQEASWVGLGWSLNAGGVITRTIRGEDDLKNNGIVGYEIQEHIGYLFIDPLDQYGAGNFEDYCLNKTWDCAGYSTFEPVYDTEADIFTFNFAGYSGKFVMKNGGPDVIIGEVMLLDPTSNIKINYSVAEQTFFAETPDGTQYLFAAKETTVPYSQVVDIPFLNSPIPQINDDPVQCSDFVEHNYQYTSSWYLSSITTEGGVIINFNYHEENKAYKSVTTRAEQRIHANSLNNFKRNLCDYSTPVDDCNVNDDRPLSKFYLSREIVNTQRLNSITWNLGKIEFVTSARKDLQFHIDTPHKLDKIMIYSYLQNSPIKTFRLSYDYFNNSHVNDADNYLYLRLKLLSIQEFGINETTSIPAYEFTYYTGDLPSKGSPSTDFWGFFNGKLNNSNGRDQLVPTVYETNPIYNILAGADKTPSIDHITVGTIKTIKYPTGDITTFSFEPNKFAYSDPVITPNVLVGFSHTYEGGGTVNNCSGTEPEKQQPITISQNTQLSVTITGANLCGGTPDANYVFGALELVGTSHNSPIDGYKWDMAQGNDHCAYTRQYNLYAGTYILRLYPKVKFGASATLEYFVQPTPPLEMTGGGIRVVKIENTEGEIRNYSYTETKLINNQTTTISSGLLMNYPLFFTHNRQILFFNEISNNCGNPGCSRIAYECIFDAYSSSSWIPLASFQSGTVIGYSKVTESQTDHNGNISRTEYYFENNSELRSPNSDIPYEYHSDNGKLKCVKYYGNNAIVKELNYANEVVTVETGVSYRYIHRDVYEYGNKSAYTKVSSEEEINYTYTNGTSQSSIKKITNYDDYSSLNYKPKKISTSTSTGISEISYITYGCDIPNGSAFIEMPVERLVTISGNITEGTLNLYNGSSLTANYSLGIIQPLLYNTFQKYIGSTININYGQAETEIEYAFGDRAYPSSVKSRNGTITNYIWGTRVDVLNNESYTYPIAKIDNSQYSGIAYTSFENNGNEGNWTFPFPSHKCTGHTGDYGYGMSNGSISKTGLISGRTYIVSYWTTNSSAFTISGTETGYPVKGKTINGWTFFEHRVSGVSSITISGTSGYIDELRLYPSNARMTTYTYEPLVGINSQTDINDVTTYYKYDEFGRLKIIQDDGRNFMKTYEYHYK